MKCESNCTACDPDHPSSCTACDQGMFLSQRKCVMADGCPRGTYPEVESRQCKYCHPSCNRCITNPTFCTVCSGYSYLHDNKCELVCPVGTYGEDNE